MGNSKLKDVLKVVFTKNDPEKLKEELNWVDKEMLEKIPENDRPIYGIYGVQRNELLFWLISAPGYPYVVYFTKEDIIFSKRKNIGLKELEKAKYAIRDIEAVTTNNGILSDSILFTFKDGKKIKIKEIARGQGEPVKKVLDQGINAFNVENLSNDHRVSAFMAYAIGDLIPKDIKIKI